MVNHANHRLRVYVIAVAVIFVLTGDSVAQGQKKPRPPTAEELAGAWVGFGPAGGEFTRLELRADGSGYCARVSPSDFTTHGYGVQIYKLSKWTIQDWHQIGFEPLPLSSNAEPITMKGEVFGSSLLIEFRGVDRRWKTSSTLYKETQFDESNGETKRAISAIQNK